MEESDQVAQMMRVLKLLDRPFLRGVVAMFIPKNLELVLVGMKLALLCGVLSFKEL